MIGRLWPWLRLLLGLGILAGLGWKIGASAFLQGLRVVSLGTVFGALGIGLVTTVCTAWRWALIAGRLGLRLPLSTAVADYYRALLLNAVLPAGVLGDAHRAVSHGRRAGDVGRGVRAVVLERLAGQLVLLVVGAAALLTQPSLVSAVARCLMPDRRILITALAVVAVLALPAARAHFGRPVDRRPAPLGGLRGAAANLFSPAVVTLSAAALLGNLTLFLVAARAAGATVPAPRLLPLLVLALLAMSLPLNVGGWGPREAVSALAFGAAGLGAAQGLTAAVVYGVLALVASLPGAVVLVLHRGALHQHRQVTAERLDQAGEHLPALVRARP